MLKVCLVMAAAAAAVGTFVAQSAPETRTAHMTRLAAMLNAGTMTPRTELAAKPTPLAPTPVVFGNQTRLDADRYGQFETDMEIGGRYLPALVDTGASFVALTYDDAASIGIRPADRDFTLRMRTANGVAKAAPAVIKRLRVGNVEAYDVQAVVSAPGALGTHNLLGMSFLKKLSGFRVDDGRLVLQQ